MYLACDVLFVNLEGVNLIQYTIPIQGYLASGGLWLVNMYGFNPIQYTIPIQGTLLITRPLVVCHLRPGWPNPIHNSNSKVPSSDGPCFFVNVYIVNPIQYPIPIQGYVSVMGHNCFSI